MRDMSIQGAAVAAAQPCWPREQPEESGAVLPVGEDQQESELADLLSQEQEEGETLLEMIRSAQEKAKAQREALKLPKNSTRYGDAPLEAYARLARAKSRPEVNAASGYARRRLAQFKTALRTDPDNAARIKAAIRGEKKKLELDRERLTELRRKRAAKEELREKEQRLRQELRRRRSQRMIRESGYMREAEISDRLATHLTATQMELRQQAQELAASTSTSLETAVQQYTDAAAPAPAPAEASFSGEA